jgi:hypothetical protein
LYYIPRRTIDLKEITAYTVSQFECAAGDKNEDLNSPPLPSFTPTNLPDVVVTVIDEAIQHSGAKAARMPSTTGWIFKFFMMNERMTIPLHTTYLCLWLVIGS